MKTPTLNDDQIISRLTGIVTKLTRELNEEKSVAAHLAGDVEFLKTKIQDQSERLAAAKEYLPTGDSWPKPHNEDCKCPYCESYRRELRIAMEQDDARLPSNKNPYHE